MSISRMGDYHHRRLLFFTVVRRSSGAIRSRQDGIRNGHILSGCWSSGDTLKTISGSVVSNDSNNALSSSSINSSTELNDSSPTTCTRSWPLCIIDGVGGCGKRTFSWTCCGKQNSSLGMHTSSFAEGYTSYLRSVGGVFTYQSKYENNFRRRINACDWIHSSPDGSSALGKRGKLNELGFLCRVHGLKYRWSSTDCIVSRYGCNDRAAYCSTSSNNSRSSTSCRCTARDADVSSGVLEKTTSFAGDVQTSTCPMPVNCAKEVEAWVPLGKLCAERNLCSRREAEFFAALDLVCVDGKPLTAATENGTARSGKLNAANSCNGSTTSVRKFPVFFVKRNADVRLMPRAQRVMDSRLTVLLHKPLHYLSCEAERTVGYSQGRPLCRQLLTADRRWDAESDDEGSICFSSGSCSNSYGRRHGKKPRLLNPGACNKMSCAGRLDSDSSGLVVFTQDGRIASLLLGGRPPALGKEYLVEVDLPVSAAALALLRSGSLTLDGRALLPASVRLLPPYCTSPVCDFSEAPSESHSFDITPLLFVPEGTPPAVLRMPHGAGEAVLQSQDKAGALRFETGGEDDEEAAPGEADQEQHGNRSSFFVGSKGGTRSHPTSRLQQHTGYEKDAPSGSCFFVGTEGITPRTLSRTIYDNAASMVALGAKDMQKHQAGQETDAFWAGKTTRMAIELFEGRHRQIRRMCELVGLRVLRLHRIRIGKIHLGSLPVGRWRLLLSHERFV